MFKEQFLLGIVLFLKNKKKEWQMKNNWVLDGIMLRCGKQSKRFSVTRQNPGVAHLQSANGAYPPYLPAIFAQGKDANYQLIKLTVRKALQV